MAYPRERARTVEDVLPSGLAEHEVLAEIEEVRERLAKKRWEAAVPLGFALLAIWTVFGDAGWISFGLALTAAFLGFVWIWRLQNRKLARLEDRAALLIAEARARDLLPEGGAT